MRTYDEPETDLHSDTEITLGTRSILGIFIGLALICGIFFGFGYSLGRSNASHISNAAQATEPQTANTAPSAIKTIVEPAAGSQPKPVAGEPMPAPTLAAANPAPAAATGQVAPATYNSAGSANGAAPANPVSATFPAPAASIMVQIAAVSRSEDATVLVSALKGLGYNASVRSEPADKLFHVQVGPFATRDQATATRAKLVSDGYNAILK